MDCRTSRRRAAAAGVMACSSILSQALLPRDTLRCRMGGCLGIGVVHVLLSDSPLCSSWAVTALEHPDDDVDDKDTTLSRDLDDLVDDKDATLS